MTVNVYYRPIPSRLITRDTDTGAVPFPNHLSPHPRAETDEECLWPTPSRVQKIDSPALDGWLVALSCCSLEITSNEKFTAIARGFQHHRMSNNIKNQ